MTQILDDPSPKPVYQSITMLGLALIGGPAGAKYGNLLSENSEAIVQLVGIIVSIIGRWRAGGVHIPVIGSKEK